MKAYLKAGFAGVLIAGLITLLVYLSYEPLFYSVAIVQAALQGALSQFVYSRRKLPYLFRIMIQMLGSWALAASCFLVIPNDWWQPSLSQFSLNWFVIWLAIYVYFYLSNHHESKIINQKLKDISHEK
ncbi:MAG: DUF3021 family protein [Lactococcus sp.]